MCGGVDAAVSLRHRCLCASSAVHARQAPPTFDVLIGKGGLGTVYRGTWAGQPVAIKVINKKWEQVLEDKGKKQKKSTSKT